MDPNEVETVRPNLEFQTLDQTDLDLEEDQISQRHDTDANLKAPNQLDLDETLDRDSDMDMGLELDMPDQDEDPIGFQDDPITLSYITQSNYHFKKWISKLILQANLFINLIYLFLAAMMFYAVLEDDPKIKRELHIKTSLKGEINDLILIGLAGVRCALYYQLIEAVKFNKVENFEKLIRFFCVQILLNTIFEGSGCWIDGVSFHDFMMQQVMVLPCLCLWMYCVRVFKRCLDELVLRKIDLTKIPEK